MESLKKTFMYRLYKKIDYLNKSLCKKNQTLKKIYIKRRFRRKLGYSINFNKSPKTYNEKLQFRKLFDKNPLYALCADKYRVREYVKKKIGEKYLVPLHFKGEILTEEIWENLPDQCVIKANHNSGPVKIIKNKNEVDRDEVINQINKQLEKSYGTSSMEYYYDDIKPLVVVEELLVDKNESLIDYKFHCFNSKNGYVAFIDVITRKDLSSKPFSNVYDLEWNALNFTNAILDKEHKEKPKNFELMKELAKALSEDFDYVRVDFYNINGKIYFGELTFCDSGGYGKFNPPEWDRKLGSYWDLNLTN